MTQGVIEPVHARVHACIDDERWTRSPPFPFAITSNNKEIDPPMPINPN